jgi:hypothetical protein
MRGSDSEGVDCFGESSPACDNYGLDGRLGPRDQYLYQGHRGLIPRNSEFTEGVHARAATDYR